MQLKWRLVCLTASARVARTAVAELAISVVTRANLVLSIMSLVENTSDRRFTWQVSGWSTYRSRPNGYSCSYSITKGLRAHLPLALPPSFWAVNCLLTFVVLDHVLDLFLHRFQIEGSRFL